MTDPHWVPQAAIITIHDRQVSRHGGKTGLRDPALLEAGCARALNLAAYGSPRLEELASAYAFGLVKAHAFIDGNKRTGFVTAATFLRLNGYGFRPEPLEGVRMMEGLASSAISEQEFGRWLGSGMIPLPKQS